MKEYPERIERTLDFANVVIIELLKEYSELGAFGVERVRAWAPRARERLVETYSSGMRRGICTPTSAQERGWWRPLRFCGGFRGWRRRRGRGWGATRTPTWFT